jgi:hypothetical protein
MIIKTKAVEKSLIKQLDDLTKSENFYWNLSHENLDLPKYDKLTEGMTLNKKYKSKYTHQLVHMLYKKGLPNRSPYQEMFNNAFKQIVNNIIKQNVELLRMKVNLLFKTDKNKPNNFHLDDKSDPNYRTCILYLNNSDGDTLIYFKNNLKRIKPEAGKVVIFDGDLYHTSSNPVKTNYRKVVNINFR